MKVAGLDPSLTSTGLALHDGTTVRIRTSAATDLLVRLAIIEDRLRAELIQDRPGLLVIEGLGGSGPGREAGLKIAGLGAILRLAVWRLGIPILEIAPATLKAYATGKGRADKGAMSVAFLDRLRDPTGPLGLSDDEVDALWLRDVGRWLSGASDVAGPHPEINPMIVDGIRARALELDPLARAAGPDARGSEASCSRP